MICSCYIDAASTAATGANVVARPFAINGRNAKAIVENPEQSLRRVRASLGGRGFEG
jgi:hypothetical protein